MATHDDSETSTAKADQAPAPDDARKPGSPRDLDKPSWKYITRKTLREFSKDQCPDLAAALTYYAVLSLFPALLALVSLLGLFGDPQKTTNALLEIVRGFAPAETVNTISGPVSELTSAPAAGFTLVIGLLTALWSASGYVGAFGRAMNRVYEVDEGRAFVKLRSTMLAVTLLAVVIVALLAGMLVLSGPVSEAVGGLIGLSGPVLLVWNIAKWPVMVLLIIAIIAVLYYATPNVKQPKFRWMSMGSAIALFVFLIASLGFGFYVGNFGNYNKTYGALGSVIIMLLWLWILNMSLLFGAEFDAEVERGRELQAGIKAEETIQLPPRDTKKSEKLQQQIEEDIKHGRELREKYSSENGQSGSGEDRDGEPGGDGQDRYPGERHRDRVREKVQHRAAQDGSDDGRRPGAGA
ncbi:YihY/virulence factor BrkB family protein [Pseudarthrobacter phenanthrenivorans]|jgi:membrane protein|uniref:Ribonuclease BN n=1 Tax=Pseudarthrobacter phenanthrenivorans TaxID=361575 RepID=A0A0B4D257_PSEPS|nr:MULTISPECIES: YihY/virulence factor BrkB family protein [Micrococcaceae]KIC67404.1 ribonuclease BN [Pseudarthrobacter phenanthrenivorans]MDJ0459576.1 YihY/virulence factor BrkB family protein [Arthrobacter sp. NQ7]